METTYDYTYEYEVTDTGKHHRTTGRNAGNYSHRTIERQQNYGTSVPYTGRTNMMDTLANLQHDRIWHKLYDPVDIKKTIHDTEIQVSLFRLMSTEDNFNFILKFTIQIQTENRLT